MVVYCKCRKYCSLQGAQGGHTGNNGRGRPQASGTPPAAASRLSRPYSVTASTFSPGSPLGAPACLVDRLCRCFCLASGFNSEAGSNGTMSVRGTACPLRYLTTESRGTVPCQRFPVPAVSNAGHQLPDDHSAITAHLVNDGPRPQLSTTASFPKKR